MYTIDNFLRSNMSKDAFETINRLTILHPQKRDGGIMQVCTDENN